MSVSGCGRLVVASSGAIVDRPDSDWLGANRAARMMVRVDPIAR